MNFFFSKDFWLAALALPVLLLSWVLSFYDHHHDNLLQRIASRLESAIQSQEKELSVYLDDSHFVELALQNRLPLSAIRSLAGKDYTLLVYRDDSLVFWSNNKAMLNHPAAIYREGNNWVQLENGFYELLKKPVSSAGNPSSEITIVGLIPVKYNYDIRNKYLQNAFINPGIPAEVRVTIDSKQHGLPVKDVAGNVLFYVNLDSNYASVNYLAIGVCALGFILLFIFLHRVAASMPHLWGFVFLLVTVGLARGLAIAYNFPAELRQLELFNPLYYASPGIAQSLGDLLINIVLVFWLSVFFYKQASVQSTYSLNPLARSLLAAVIYGLLLLLTDWMVEVFRSFVMDSKISLDINNIFSLSIYTVWGWIALCMILASFFLLTYQLLSLLSQLKVVPLAKFISMLAALAIYYVVTFDNITLIVSMGMLLYVYGIERYGLYQRRINQFTFQNILFLLIIFSLFASSLLYYFNDVKENNLRRWYAEKLSIERDPVAEYLFNRVQNELIQDSTIKTCFINRDVQGFEKQVQKHFRVFFSRKYNSRIYALGSDGKGCLGDTTATLTSINKKIEQKFVETANPYLFHHKKGETGYAYITRLPLYYHNVPLGFLIIEWIPRLHQHDVVYPELLLDDKIRPPDELEKYDYAIYIPEKLIKKHGAYPYNTRLQQSWVISEEFDVVLAKGFSHLLYHNAATSKTIVISKKQNGIFTWLSLFSYNFCLLLLIIFVFWVTRLFLGLSRTKSQLISVFTSSLKFKIQFVLVFSILFSFASIAVVTIYNLQNQYKNSHREQLVKKIEALSSEIRFLLTGSDSSFAAVTPGIAKLAENHSIDVNIYRPSGHLLASSQENIFEKGLIAPDMNSIAYYYLNRQTQSLFIQEEHIGRLQYLSAYTPVQDKAGRTLAYLNLPYFSDEKDLAREIASFLTALINVYVLLLLIAGVVALFISNSITRPLAIIGERLKQLTFGKQNAPIQWQSDDEIGALVNEYNKMIFELEHSAQMLARSERESAWREMAKQVAHEIKNPLTTMRLSIQHLQRAHSDQAANLKEIMERTTRMLVEQMDNLSNIASAFSSFAQMPKPNNEPVNVGEVISNAASLFRENEQQVQIELHLLSSACFVFADKHQLLQVFNNLLQNALQAIPDDREGKVEIHVEREGTDNLVVKVTDNGAGITDEQKEKIFIPNFTTKSSGMGLGLAITKSIVEHAKGRIWFESAADAGTTFFVELPLMRNNENEYK